MSKYEEALEKIKQLATQQYSDFVYGKTTKMSAIQIETDLINNANILKELLVNKND